MRRQGRIPQQGATPQEVARNLGQLGAANLQHRAIGFGTREPNSFVGKLNAQWVSAVPDGSGILTLPHTLGEVPVAATVEHYENSATPGTIIAAGPYHPEKWSASQVQLQVQTIVGSLTGLRVHVMVKGG